MQNDGIGDIVYHSQASTPSKVFDESLMKSDLENDLGQENKEDYSDKGLFKVTKEMKALDVGKLGDLVSNMFYPQIPKQFPTVLATTSKTCQGCGRYLRDSIVKARSASWVNGQQSFLDCAKQKRCNNTDRFPHIVLDTSWKRTADSDLHVYRLQNSPNPPFALGLIDNLPGPFIDKKSPSNCIGGEKTREVSCRTSYASENGCDYRSLKIQPASWNFMEIDDCKDFMARIKAGEFLDFMWAVKSQGSHGKGVKVVKGASSIVADYGSCKQRHHILVQQYIEKPALVKGHKFDLRTYLLVSSTDPLIAFYHDGFVRRASHKYSSDPNDVLSHVTNSVGQQKKDHFYNFTWLAAALYEQDPVNFPMDYMDTLFRPRVKRVLNFLVQAAKIEPIKGRFHLFAMDWVIDGEGSVWLLEGNLNPRIGHYENIGLTPMVFHDFLEVVRQVQMDPQGFKTPPLASNGFEYRGWGVVYNQLEAEAANIKYHPCLFKEYTIARHPLFSYAKSFI